jgi:hypothetical protein
MSGCNARAQQNKKAGKQQEGSPITDRSLLCKRDAPNK